MKLEVQESKKIEEGKHNGKIVSVNASTTSKFDYMDYSIELDEGIIVKYGVPTKIVVDEKSKEPQSNHAKLLHALGFDLTKDIDTDDAVGKKVTCMIMYEENERGKFHRVVENSVKLA